MDCSIPGLLLLLVTTGATSAHLPSFHDNGNGFPSCSELRALWSALSQSMMVSQVTNEIPLLPREVVDIMLRKSPGRGNRRHGLSQKPSLQEIILGGAGLEDKPSLHPFSSEEHPISNIPTIPETIHFPGIFDPNIEYVQFDNDIQPEPVFSGFFGSSEADKQARYLEDFDPPWGSPKDVGTFGRFAKDGGSSHLVAKMVSPTAGRKTINSNQRKGDAQQVICEEIVNTACSFPNQCTCSGWPSLECVHGKCTLLHAATGSISDFGFWHEAPLHRSQMGLVSPARKKRSKSIYM